MLLPPEIFSSDLTGAEFKTLVALYQVAEKDIVTASTEELAGMTGYSTESLRRAFRGLEEKNLILITRTKRNFGRFYFNVYRLLLPPPPHNPVDSPPHIPHKPVGWSAEVEAAPSHTDVGSTLSDLPIQSMTNRNQLAIRKTHYVRLTLARDARKVKGKSTPMVNRYEDDFDGGGAAGLLPEELDAKDQKRNRKSQPNTRHTATDISRRLSEANPLVPKMLNVMALAKILAQYRRQYSVPHEVEKAIVELWFEEPRNVTGIESLTPAQLLGKFLHFYRANIVAGYAHAGMSWNESTSAPATVIFSAPSHTSPAAQLLAQQPPVASDGTTFSDTPGGRKHLAEYESRLLERTK
jgi:hypothetical protein